MYLSQLEVIGFKSFAQKTKFKFNQGISAVVGPNGCGKTNVVDAIRWVLGEQKSAVLRSEVMDNVIFNGTKSRKPLSMAEVSLLVINNRGVLPSDYHDITVTRRIYRNGESEYLINNTKCRLKDITELFMDTGMGSDSYSVIELKMVEAILSGRPEERRHLIEEAAGVNKYKQRRKEANRKLQTIQLDLQRINDIVLEIEKSVNSFSRQAAKTKRYNKLMERHKELETALLINDFKVFNDSIKEINEKLIKENILKSEEVKKLTDLEQDAEDLKQRINEINLILQEIKDKELSVSAEISAIKQNHAVASEKLSSYSNNLARIDDDKIEQKNKAEKINERNKELDTLIVNSQSEYDNTTSSLSELDAKRKEKKQIVEEIREQIQEISSTSSDLRGNINNIKNNVFRNNARLSSLNELIDKVESDIESSQTEIEGIKQNIAEKQELSSSLSIKLSEAQKEFAETQEKKATLKEEIEKIQVQINEIKNSLSASNASLCFLKNLSDKDANTNFLLDNRNWNLNYEKNILIESIATDEKYRVAIESAISHLKNAIIIDDISDASEAIDKLKKSHKGKSSFIINNLTNELHSNAPSITFDDKIIAYAVDLVRVSDKLKPFISNYLANTIIVDTLETAKQVIADKLADTAITLSGEILNSFGYLKAGGVLDNEGQIVGKNERIQLIIEEIQSNNATLQDLQTKLEDLNTDYKQINIDAITSHIKSIERDINNNENVINHLNSKITAIQQNVQAYEKNNIRYVEEITTLERENEDLNSSLDKYEEEFKLSQEEVRTINSELENKEKELKATESEYYQAEMNKIRIEAQINSFKNERDRNIIEVDSIQKKLASFDDEKANLEANILSTNSSIAKLTEQIEQKEAESEGYKTSFSDTNSHKLQLDEEERQYNSEINIARQQIEKFSDSIHQLDIKLSEVTTNLRNLNERAFEVLEVEIQNYEGTVIEIESIPEAKSELNELKEKLSQLGSVNFLALEQFEKETERYNFYNKQLADLNESEKTLKETISEINDTAEKKFRETFELVNSNFQMLFKKLFNDEADSQLNLTGDSVLDCDIEIMAKPPGKKPHSIDMLSQGEKTLTAIALLFGIYLVKPSPFCILDEVDAPLDDMNIDRFLGMIKQFSVDTQFLMVTHNKKTMTAADTLYGITMQEEGVSKVVSVKFNQEDKHD